MTPVERYLVDTTVLIDLSKGVMGIRSWLDVLSASGAELGVCAVNVAEFFSGIPSNQQARWEDLLSEFQYWNVSYEDAVRAGVYRSTLARRGLTLHLGDALVAAVAMDLGATVLTDNIRHFLLISGLRVRSPRS